MKFLRLLFAWSVRLTLLATLLYTSQVSFSQQDPMYTHYMFNKAIYNPAYNGINREYIDVTFLFHTQWVGFEGQNIDKKYVGKPPQTQSFSINAPIPNSNFGLGLNIVNDAEGFNFFTGINLAVSYKTDFSFGTLHAGINGGANQAGIKGEWLPPTSGTDPLIPTGEVSNFAPDLGAGVYLFSTMYYVGLSGQHLLQSKFDWTDVNGGIYEQVRIYFATAGYNFSLPNNPDWLIQPSALVKIDPGRWQLEGNINALYRERFWGGLSFKQGGTISALLGMQMTPNLKFGYSYDYTANQLRRVNTGTHEVMINYIFKITIKKVEKPTIIHWTPRWL